MALTQAAEKPTFESVWALMQENAQQLKELRESFKESQKEQKEQKELDRQMKEDFNIRLGKLTNLFGDFTLGMIAPKLREKFREFGYDFPQANLNVEINDYVNNIHLETDIVLENGDKVILVEVKTKLTAERINKHIERLEKRRKYADIRGDKRTFLGAVAGFAVSGEVREIALKEGLYLIEPDGENFTITPPIDKPREW